MGSYPCGYCRVKFKTFAEVRAHGSDCGELKRRLAELPSDLNYRVHKGGMKLEAAEREAAKRPKIGL